MVPRRSTLLQLVPGQRLRVTRADIGTGLTVARSSRVDAFRKTGATDVTVIAVVCGACLASRAVGIAQPPLIQDLFAATRACHPTGVSDKPRERYIDFDWSTAEQLLNRHALIAPEL